MNEPPPFPFTETAGEGDRLGSTARLTTGRWAPFLLFVSFFFALQIVLRSQPFSDPGALWHIKVGEWIFEHEAFPHTDPFTWSYAGKFWVPQQWAAECLMAFTFQIGGLDSLLTAMNALLAVVAAWIGKRFIDNGLHPLPAAGIVAFGLATASYHFYLRPHLFTIVFTALIMAWLVDFERRRNTVKEMVWLIPLCVLWTNLHGGVLGGIATFGLAIIGWYLARDRAGHECKMLALIAAGCLLATLCNPFFLDMHRTWFSIVGSKAISQFVTEHQVLSLARTDGQAIMGFACFYFFMLAGTWPKQPRVSWLIPIVWFVLTATSIRHGPLFVVAALIALADFIPETRWFEWLRKHGDTFARSPIATSQSMGIKDWAPMLGVVLLALALQGSGVRVPVIGRDWARFDKKLVPVELIGPLREYAATRPPGFPIFNDANLGGFVIYFAPNLKVFMDDRFELYGESGLNDYMDMINDHPERIEDWAANTPFDRALVECDGVMDAYLVTSHRWSQVARGTKAVLYARSQPVRQYACDGATSSNSCLNSWSVPRTWRVWR